MDRRLEALRLIVRARSRPSVRLLDAIYGLAAQELRASVASVMEGRKIAKSAREAQYGQVRTSLCSTFGAAGLCIAEIDADFEAKAAELIERFNLS